uniref:Uncharacterized protein n=1 Tax=viral metagenome TaxID=1070528 RepID=A0A6C0IA16_9ZZZZ
MIYLILVSLLLIMVILSKSSFTTPAVSKVVYVECDSKGNEISNQKYFVPKKNTIMKLANTEYIKFITFDLPSCYYRLYCSNVNVKGFSSPPIMTYGLMVNTVYKSTTGNFYINVVK